MYFCTGKKKECDKGELRYVYNYEYNQEEEYKMKKEQKEMLEPQNNNENLILLKIDKIIRTMANKDERSMNKIW